MSHRVRFVNHGLLVLVVLLGVAVLSQDRPGSRADAEANQRDDLGPTDGLILRGTKGDLRVRDAEGRLAWGDRPTDRVTSIAFVHVDRIMTLLMDAPRLSDERKALEDRERSKMEEFQAKRDEFIRQYGRVNPDHPDFERASEAWRVLRESLDQWQQEMSKDNERLLKEQIDVSWKEILSAIDVVAERKGVDIVLRFVPTAEPFVAEDPTGGISQLLGRTVLKMPETLDLTSDVMRQLNLRDE
ncbi:MAG: OmpH family outer membrane protein [Phycisphaeraceae bacterium]|nr:OmpH family outer membrane protein [Phycisphaeraceae bacterium]